MPHLAMATALPWPQTTRPDILSAFSEGVRAFLGAIPAFPALLIM